MEEWRDIAITDGSYQVSDLGRVRRAKSGQGTYKNRILKNLENQDGYHNVRLYFGQRCDWKHLAVHRLVALAFIGDPPQGKDQVNHKDGNRTNNVPGNLEWVSSLENQLHAIRYLERNASLPRGKEHHNSVLTETQVREIKSTYCKGKRGFGTPALAKKFGVTQRSIWNIVSGRTWNHISAT